MSSHPLEVTGPPASKQKRFLQPRFKQVGPIGDGPRIILAAQSGMGKTTAALVLLKEYLRVVDLVWLISGTIDVDPAYKEANNSCEINTSERALTLKTLNWTPFAKT